MKKMDRRRFLALSAATAASLHTLARAKLPPHKPPPSRSTPTSPARTIPANFVGLSYETQQLSDPAFFSPHNTGLIAQFRALAPHGVLRIGGNTSDVGWWKPTPTSTQPPLPAKVVIIPLRPDEQPIPEARLRHHARKPSPTSAPSSTPPAGPASTASTSAPAPPSAPPKKPPSSPKPSACHKLEYFQLGNEPDIFYNRFRVKADWTVDAYLDEWLAAAERHPRRVPHARFGLPDTSGNPSGLPIVDASPSRRPPATAASAAVWYRSHGHPNIAAISHHYYFTGPPSNPKANIDRPPQARPQGHTARRHRPRRRRKARNTHYRMTEGNTCYRGGKPGFSDVFAAALWAADYLPHPRLPRLRRRQPPRRQRQSRRRLPRRHPPRRAPHARPQSPPPPPLLHPHRRNRRQVHRRTRRLRHDVGKQSERYADGTHRLRSRFGQRYCLRCQDERRKSIVIINKDSSADLKIKISGMKMFYAERLLAASLTSTDVTLGDYKLTEEAALAQWKADVAGKKIARQVTRLPGVAINGRPEVRDRDTIDVPEILHFSLVANSQRRKARRLSSLLIHSRSKRS